MDLTGVHVVVFGEATTDISFHCLGWSDDPCSPAPGKWQTLGACRFIHPNEQYWSVALHVRQYRDLVIPGAYLITETPDEYDGVPVPFIGFDPIPVDMLAEFPPELRTRIVMLAAQA